MKIIREMQVIGKEVYELEISEGILEVLNNSLNKEKVEGQELPEIKESDLFYLYNGPESEIEHLTKEYDFQTHDENRPTVSMKYSEAAKNILEQIIMNEQGNFEPQDVQSMNTFVVFDNAQEDMDCQNIVM